MHPASAEHATEMAGSSINAFKRSSAIGPVYGAGVGVGGTSVGVGGTGVAVAVGIGVEVIPDGVVNTKGDVSGVTNSFGLNPPCIAYAMSRPEMPETSKKTMETRTITVPSFTFTGSLGGGGGIGGISYELYRVSYDEAGTGCVASTFGGCIGGYSSVIIGLLCAHSVLPLHTTD